jgi:hypothetical protein
MDQTKRKLIFICIDAVKSFVLSICQTDFLYHWMVRVLLILPDPSRKYVMHVMKHPWKQFLVEIEKQVLFITLMCVKVVYIFWK